MRPVFLACAALVACLTAGLASAQNDRRDRQDPELVIESGGRTGTCDYLTFTADGNHLLAVGDDKVVRVWPYRGGKLDPDGMKVLRWSVWREQRGAIYALALSPDKGGRRVAVGGYGVRDSTVAVIDRITGRILHTVTPRGKPDENFYAVRAVAFAPSGDRVAYGTTDGSVWLWDFKANLRVGKHQGKTAYNRVRLVHFLDDKRLLSVAESGEVLRWDLTASPPTSTALAPLRVEEYSCYQVTLSPDGRWLAAAAKGPVVAVRSLDGKHQKDIRLEKGQFPRSVAFDPRGGRLAVSIGTIPHPDRPGFHVEGDDRIRFYDLTASPPTATAGPRHTYRAEFLAFHPDGVHLAVAGGDNHEVTLWDLLNPDRPDRVAEGKGTCLWGVALSPNGRYLGFLPRRDPAGRDPNRRGTGPWRVFDLPGRQWVEAKDFKPVPNRTEAGGWHVEPSANPYRWYAVHRDGARHLLPLDGAREGMPRCYAFLAPGGAAPGRGGQRPVRLAVGHYWGLSVYELTAGEARRVRLCTGHQGEVTALAVSADQKWLVSASNDQTIAAWSLADGEAPGGAAPGRGQTQPRLGAGFAVRGGRLRVEAVDVGSPAWEAGLVEKDEVTLFAFGVNRFLYDPDNQVPAAERRRRKIEAATADPEECLGRLRRPVPGQEHYFRVRRAGRTLDLLTTVRQRPLWRFFPTRDGEWVLWMWRNSFYDTSTKGDFSIGWHVNSPDLDREPAFYRAEQFRKHFERPDVIDKLLLTHDVRAALHLVSDNPLPQRFDDREPPAVQMELGAVRPGQDVKATLRVTPHGDNPDLQPGTAELWVNDHRVGKWDDIVSWDKEGRRPTYRRTVAVPYARLRAGRNVLTFQTYNRLGGRSDAVAPVLCDRHLPDRPRLLGLAAGINDYSAALPAPGGKRALGNLESACKDAEAIRSTWASQPRYAGADIFLHLDARAGRKELLDALDDLARRAGPDDLCVLFLAGHGVFREGRRGGDSSFVFCCPRYDPSRPADTGLTSRVLYDRLAAIPCRKLLILDACHSGAAANPVRDLTPGGQGPVILAACDRNQSSYENKKYGHGLFTYALLEALDGRRDLDVRGLFAYARSRLPDLLAEIDLPRYQQVPILFAPQPLDENYLLARKKGGPVAAP
jgi:WD40 repeat protein